MRGDFTRLRVTSDQDEIWLQQQGRVWLDSDWNEAAVAALRRLERGTADVVGSGCAAPAPGTGFSIRPGPANDFEIGGGPGSRGHLYVDGILCAKEEPCTYLSQTALPGPPPLPLPSLTRSEWRPSGSLETGRARHTATLLGDGRVLVVGGESAGAPTSTAEVYDPPAGRCTSVPPLRTARLGHTATRLVDGRVLIAGGQGAGGIQLSSCELYDPLTGRWAITGPLGTPRAFHTATRLHDGRVLVVGGAGSVTTVAAGSPPLATAEIYDPATGTWSASGSLSEARSTHTATLLPSSGTERVLVAGGTGEAGPLRSVEVFDDAAGTWRSEQPLAQARAGHTATWANNAVLVFGGTGPTGPLASVEEWTGSWVTLDPMATARTGHGLATLPHGQILVAGGSNLAGALQSAELWHPYTHTWTQVPALTQARMRHTLTTVSTGVIAVGGTGRTGPGLPAQGLRSSELYLPPSRTYAVVYVDVWRRLVTWMQDDSVREVALGGPDTTARLRTVPQVRVVGVPADHQPATLSCGSAAAYVPRPGRGRLTTGPVATTTVPDGCSLPDDVETSALGNRLYRVEVHEGGETPDGRLTPPLPLHRDALAGDRQITVASPLTAETADRLRTARCDLVLPGSRGEALDIEEVDTVSGVIGLRSPLRNGYAVTSGPALVRPLTGVPITAEAGPGSTTLTVDPDDTGRFLDPARSSIPHQWVLRSGSDGEAISVDSVDAALGSLVLSEPIRGHYLENSEIVPRARFKWSRDNAGFAVRVTAVLTADPLGPATVVKVDSLGQDSATALREGDLVEIVGDTEELSTGAGLLCRVAADPDPDNLTVTLDAAHPQLQPTGSEAGVDVLAVHLLLRRWEGTDWVGAAPKTLDDGISIQFSGEDVRSGDYWWFVHRTVNGVEQRYEAPPDGPVHSRAPLAIVGWTGDAESGAHLSPIIDCVPVFDPLAHLHADKIAFDDGTCRLGANTVQEALEKLCHPAVYPVVARAGISWDNDAPLSVTALNDGLVLSFSEPLHPGSLSDRSVQVHLDLPTEEEGVRGRRRLALPGTVVAVDRSTYRFVPARALSPETVRAWASRAAELGDPGIRTWVTLKGDVITDAAGHRHLDGDVFGYPVQVGYGYRTRLRLPSGDAVEGGDFQSWFYLVPPPPRGFVEHVTPGPDASIRAFPSSIMIVFSAEVRARSVNTRTIRVTGADGVTVPGVVEPYPFARGVELISRATFTGRPARPGQTFTIEVLGGDERGVLDATGEPIEGFESRFLVTGS